MSPRRAMTLLEVLVSLLIVSIVLTVLFTVYSVGLNWTSNSLFEILVTWSSTTFSFALLNPMGSLADHDLRRRSAAHGRCLAKGLLLALLAFQPGHHQLDQLLDLSVAQRQITFDDRHI